MKGGYKLKLTRRKMVLSAVAAISSTRSDASVDAVLDEITISYDTLEELLHGHGKQSAVAGDVIKAGEHSFVVLSASTRDFDVETASGLKLRVLSNAPVSPSQFGLEPDIRASTNSDKFQRFIDYISKVGCEGRANAGTYFLPSSVSVQFEKGSEHGFKLSGVGIGTIFHFLSGSLKVHKPNHILSDFRVKSDTDHGIQIAPKKIGIDSRTENAARGAMYNVRAEHCAKSGFYFEYCWIYTMVNCFGRRCSEYGLQLGDGSVVGCNALNVIGGEWQANGKAIDGGAVKSTGGGIFVGRSVHVDINTTIEGNYGDGLVIGEQTRGLSISGYFEKNGSSSLDLDINTLVPRLPVNAASDIIVHLVNVTAQKVGGERQHRSMKFVDVDNLYVTHAKFFKQASNGGVIYDKEPILVIETEKGKASGYIENCSYGSSEYKQEFLRNDCERFGLIEKTIVATASEKGVNQYHLLEHNKITDGARIEVRCVVALEGSHSSAASDQLIQFNTKYGMGDTGKIVSVKTNTLSSTEGLGIKYFNNYTSKEWGGWVHILVERIDGVVVDIKMLRIEIMMYKGIANS